MLPMPTNMMNGSAQEKKNNILLSRKPRKMKKKKKVNAKTFLSSIRNMVSILHISAFNLSLVCLMLSHITLNVCWFNMKDTRNWWSNFFICLYYLLYFISFRGCNSKKGSSEKITTNAKPSKNKREINAEG